MELLEDLKMPLLKFNFVMIYTIHKTLVFLKNYIKDNILKCLFTEYNRILFF